jgi:hypothetical protein
MTMDDGARTPIRDPLEESLTAERVNYETGVMLNADDFRAEQSYHRARLARALSCALGMGTLAGLRVKIGKGVDGAWEVIVEPGVAIDRRGRMIEVGREQCIRIDRWLQGESPAKLHQAFNADGTTIIADIFLSAHVCGRAKTPAFAAGPFDALDAVVPARLEDGFSLTPVLRLEDTSNVDGVDVPRPPLPKNFWPSDAAARLDAVLGSWPERAEAKAALQEHIDGLDNAAIFLARIEIPATPNADATKHPAWRAAEAKAENRDRPIIFLSGKWLGEPYTKPA